MFRFFGAAAAVFLALSLSCGAQARPRDDVMAAAATCGTETGGRAWLDCYYKATAPMRTALGLAPLSSAPARKPAAMTAAELSARDQVLSAAYGCTTVAEDRGWLDCYYGAAQPLRAALGLPPAPQVTPVSSIARPPEASFGIPPASAKPLRTASHIVSRMTAYHLNAYGIFTITLANGQVWQQVDGDTYHAKLSHPPESYVVKINRGMLGSYNVLISDVPGLFRAERVS
jgi:hypothetical protein